MYMIGVILFPLYGRFPRFRVISPYVGFALIIISLVAGSFANEVWQLLLTQGVLYAIGGGMVYYPTTVFLDEWFIKKKGFAFGIMWVSNRSLLCPTSTKQLTSRKGRNWCRRSRYSFCHEYWTREVWLPNHASRICRGHICVILAARLLPSTAAASSGSEIGSSWPGISAILFLLAPSNRKYY